MKEEIRNTENAEKKGRRILSDEELEQASGGQMDITIFDVANPDKGLVKDNEDLELSKLVDRPFMGSFYPTLK